jgi:hypothetical protein
LQTVQGSTTGTNINSYQVFAIFNLCSGKIASNDVLASEAHEVYRRLRGEAERREARKSIADGDKVCGK